MSLKTKLISTFTFLTLSGSLYAYIDMPTCTQPDDSFQQAFKNIEKHESIDKLDRILSRYSITAASEVKNHRCMTLYMSALYSQNEEARRLLDDMGLGPQSEDELNDTTVFTTRRMHKYSSPVNQEYNLHRFFRPLKEQLSLYEFAVAFGTVEAALELEGRGGELRSETTRLILAARYNNAQAIADYLSMGEDTDYRDNDRRSVFYYVVYNRSLNVLKTLVDSITDGGEIQELASYRQILEGVRSATTLGNIEALDLLLDLNVTVINELDYHNDLANIFIWELDELLRDARQDHYAVSTDYDYILESIDGLLHLYGHPQLHRHLENYDTPECSSLIDFPMRDNGYSLARLAYHSHFDGDDELFDLIKNCNMPAIIEREVLERAITSNRLDILSEELQRIQERRNRRFQEIESIRETRTSEDYSSIIDFQNRRENRKYDDNITHALRVALAEENPEALAILLREVVDRESERFVHIPYRELSRQESCLLQSYQRDYPEIARLIRLQYRSRRSRINSPAMYHALNVLEFVTEPLLVQLDRRRYNQECRDN